MHDKRLADEENLRFEKEIRLLMDSGFAKYQPANAICVIPEKSSKHNPMTEEKKERNRSKSKERVFVENAIGGVKTWRVVKEICRSWLHQTRDLIMLLACGLHNLKIISAET